MELKKVKELAARTFNVGIHRVKIKDSEKAKEAITREDIKRLVKTGAIEIKPKRGSSRGRARTLAKKKKLGRRRGPGSRKGKKTARKPAKKAWMEKVRALRKTLKELRPENYRELYKKVKGGFFRSKRHLLSYIRGVK